MFYDDMAIQVRGVSKCYEVYKQPQDRLKQMMMPRLHRFFNKSPQNYYQPFWALQDISFEIPRGQCVGIMGKNGSGKSTLLQMIVGTLQPTHGEINTNGHVAALLELGSGFNPEFTGMENIYLSGTLIGLERVEIDEKFDEIITFADIGEHINYPVKTYSSGMMLRLAFAVQMAVEPDILIIDEAMAVGDARFQLKCFKRLQALKEKGTTIILVSHSIETIRSFCDTGIVLDQGRFICFEEVKAASGKYYSILFPKNKSDIKKIEPKFHIENNEKESADKSMTDSTYKLTILPEKSDCETFGVGNACVTNIQIHGLKEPNLFMAGQKINIICQFSWNINAIKKLLTQGLQDKNITIGVALADKKGSYIFGCNGFDFGLQIDCLSKPERIVEFSFVLPVLKEGDYFMSVAVALGKLDNHIQLKWYDCLIPLKCLKSDKNTFGLIAIDYNMKLLQFKRKQNEQVAEAYI